MRTLRMAMVDIELAMTLKLVAIALHPARGILGLRECVEVIHVQHTATEIQKRIANRQIIPARYFGAASS